MRTIEGETFTFSYEPETHTLTWQGACRLHGAEYDPIATLFTEAIAAAPATMKLDICRLGVLNGDGINVLSRFLLALRDQGHSGIVIDANQGHAWQRKTLLSLQRLLAGVDCELAW